MRLKIDLFESPKAALKRAFEGDLYDEDELLDQAKDLLIYAGELKMEKEAKKRVLKAQGKK